MNTIKIKPYFFIALVVVLIALELDGIIKSESDFSTIYNAIFLAINVMCLLYWIKYFKKNS